MTYQKTIEEIARNARAIHVAMLQSALGATNTGGTCLYAAILLQEIMKAFHKETPTVIRGGGGGADGGYRDCDGKCRGHYWVEAKTPEGSFVIDITADQFGSQPCLVLPLSQAQKNYVPGRQDIVSQHVTQELSEIFRQNSQDASN